MARTSTSFKKGHHGLGGRPQGIKNGAGRDAWRVAGRRRVHIARRIDDLQSALLKCGNLSTDQLVRLVELVGIRKKHYDNRSKYLRPLVRTGRLELVYPQGVRYDASVGRCTRTDRSQLTMSKRARTSRPDRGARSSLPKIRELDKIVRTLLDEVSNAETTTDRSSDANSRLRALSALIKAEAELLNRSCDPRPVEIYRPFRIILSHIPYDPEDPNPDQPLRGLGRPSDIWTKAEIRADLEQRKQFYLGRGLEPPAWLHRIAVWCEEDRGDRDGTRRADTSPRTPGLKTADPKPQRGREGTARAEASPRTGGTKADSPKPPRPNETISEDIEARKFLEEFPVEEDTPSECTRCGGRGHLIRFVHCRHCDGAGRTWNADDSSSECSQCKGTGCRRARGRPCPDCQARAVGLEDTEA